MSTENQFKNALHLRAEGEYAILEIEVEKGKWVQLIKERLDSPFSHIIDPLGIQRAIENYNVSKNKTSSEPPIVVPKWIQEWNQSGSDKYPL